jgi:hypothetical protein
LGAQLYPSVTATVAELISNAWDADANNVWVEIPFDEDWNNPDAQIVVTDDGHGMTRAQAQEAYLVVGRRKRFGPLGDRSEGGRLVHGRKGIGKLAAFGTAGYLECTTLRDGIVTAFGIDYNELRLLNPDQDYYVDPVREVDPLTSPDGTLLDHGTRVRLSMLRVKRQISAETFRLSMSRRFAIKDMAVWINGTALARFDMPLQFRLPRDGQPPEVEVDSDGWAVEALPNGDVVRWWIGFTEKPLAEGDQQGLSVLARQKMAQRPFKFERSAGTTAQLGYEYLVGEVEADWLDQGDDVDTDYIQSNRDQIQVEDPRLDEFMRWGRSRLAWALKTRQELREKIVADTAEANPELAEILDVPTVRERKALEKVAQRLMRVPEMELSTVNSIMRTVMSTRADSQMREMVREFQSPEFEHQNSVANLAREIDSVDLTRLSATIDARVDVLQRLIDNSRDGLVQEGLQDLVRSELWLIDPRLHILSQEIDLDSRSGEEMESGERIFIVAPDRRVALDEVAVIQVLGNETRREITNSLVDEFTALVRRVGEHYRERSSKPIVRGYLVGPSVAGDVPRLVRDADARTSVSTWEESFARSRDLHLGWHDIAQVRAGEKL